MTNEQILQLVRHHAIDHEYWSETRTLAFARALLSASKPAAPKSCQTGWGDICHMAKHDGVTCPNESCDIDDGIRAAPAQSGEPVIPSFVTEQHRADFQRLYSLLEDGEGYDIPKDRMESLANTGLIRKTRGSVYEFTQFGMAMQDALFGYAVPPSQPAEGGETKRFATLISISTEKICEIAGKYNLGNPRLDALRCFVNEIIIVNEAEYAKSE